MYTTPEKQSLDVTLLEHLSRNTRLFLRALIVTGRRPQALDLFIMTIDPKPLFYQTDG
jgi:hypothetical protein